MRIILVDDSRKHREAGVADLTVLGHEVLAFRDYEEALGSMRKGGFDAALLDLLMPAESMTLGQSGLEFLGQSIPAGWALSMVAANCGIPLIAVATDKNHHDHPASAMMDWFARKRMQVNGSAMLWMHAPMRSDGAKNWPAVLTLLQSGE